MLEIHDRDVVPERPKNVAPPGTLVVHPVAYLDPQLVIETKAFWGNPNCDNTADHWYWQYLIYDGVNEMIWVEAKRYKQFQAQ